MAIDHEIPPYTTLELTGGDLADERIRVRARLATGKAIEVDYCEGAGWESTQWLHTDGTRAFLAAAGRRLAADALQIPREEFRCRVEVIQ